MVKKINGYKMKKKMLIKLKKGYYMKKMKQMLMFYMIYYIMLCVCSKNIVKDLVKNTLPNICSKILRKFTRVSEIRLLINVKRVESLTKRKILIVRLTSLKCIT